MSDESAGLTRRDVIKAGTAATLAGYAVGVEKALGQAIKDAKDNIPPQFEDLKTVPESLSGGSLSLNLGGDTLLRLTLESADDAAATKLEAMLGQGATPDAVAALRRG